MAEARSVEAEVVVEGKKPVPVKNKPKKKAKIIHPKEIAEKKVKELEKDVFAIMWLILIIVLVILTVFFKPYLKQIINISIVFMIFYYMQPLMFGMTGRTVTTFLSRGQKVPVWKKFPLFVLVVVIINLLYSGIQTVLDIAFPEEHVNIVFVIVWMGFLYLMWVSVFSKGREPGKIRG